MNSKAIRKQLLAAVAMVLVAAVALGSSTYAWFVSNNTVKATTSTISAQSNAPFLMIDKGHISEASQTAISFADDTPANTKLYPAQVINGTNAVDVSNKTTYKDKPLFQSAYASTATAQTMLAGSRFDVGSPDTAAQADTEPGGGYALKKTFYIGTADDKAGSFKDLKVASVELVNNTTSQLNNALCVLVTCGNNWAVYKKTDNGTVLANYANPDTGTGAGAAAGGYHDNTSARADAGILADTIAAGEEVLVNVYLFYDGSATEVFTNNLENLKDIGATITFTATPVSTSGTTGPEGNTNPLNAVLSFAADTKTLSSNIAGATSYAWTASNGGTITSGADTNACVVSTNGTYTLTVVKGGQTSVVSYVVSSIT